MAVTLLARSWSGDGRPWRRGGSPLRGELGRPGPGLIGGDRCRRPRLLSDGWGRWLAPADAALPDRRVGERFELLEGLFRLGVLRLLALLAAPDRLLELFRRDVEVEARHAAEGLLGCSSRISGFVRHRYRGSRGRSVSAYPTGEAPFDPQPLCQARAVRTSAPCSVTAIVCSKWAASVPSAETTVHRSVSTRVGHSPAITMGSMAITRPGRISGPRPGGP